MNFVIVEHKMSDAQLGKAIREEGRVPLANRLTGMNLQGCMIGFSRSPGGPLVEGSWFDVKDVLPPTASPVLVFNGVGMGFEHELEVTTFTDGIGWGNEFDGFRDEGDEPTHWMLIPDPPETLERKANQ